MPAAVSVIILAYREPDFLNALFGSLAAQTLAPVEILVVDDASGPEHTARYRLPANARLLINPQNLALAAISRNRALREARGEFIALVDQDDLWHPDKLAIQVAALESRPEALLHYTHQQNVDAALQPLPVQLSFHPPGPDPLAHLLRHNTIPYSSVLLRRAVLDRIGLFDESIRGAADWDLWLRIAAAGTILADSRPLLVRRRHVRQWSKSRLLMAQADEKVLAKTLNWLPSCRPDLLPLARRRHARSLRRLGHVYLDEGCPNEGLQYLRGAARLCPWDLRTGALLLRAHFARRSS
jgi:glycosyltransferase involved in cell wall biosynthesis